MNSIQKDKKKLMVIKDPEIKDFFMKDLSNYVKKNNITCDGKTYYIFFEKMSVIISRTKNLKEKAKQLYSSIALVTTTCCSNDNMLLTNQYSTKPEGK